MKTWQIELRLVRWRPGIYALLLLFSVIVFGLPIVSGLLMQRFFDALSGGGSGGLGLWDIVALLVALEFRQLLTGYTASRLPGSPSEAVSRFRDDVEVIVEAIDGWNDLIGRTAFAVAAQVDGIIFVGPPRLLGSPT